jgi:fumarylacetoacetate (FAA) hydrolase family protein
MIKEAKTFDITEYAKKAREALNRLEQTQQPGQLISGGKSDVVRHIKADIKALMDKGYTAQQVADALKIDVFSILPKSITEIVKGKKLAAVKKPRSATTTQVTTQATTQSERPVTSTQQSNTNSTFQIKPDTPDGEL